MERVAKAVRRGVPRPRPRLLRAARASGHSHPGDVPSFRRLPAGERRFVLRPHVAGTDGSQQAGGPVRRNCVEHLLLVRVAPYRRQPRHDHGHRHGVGGLAAPDRRAGAQRGLAREDVPDREEVPRTVTGARPGAPGRGQRSSPSVPFCGEWCRSAGRSGGTAHHRQPRRPVAGGHRARRTPDRSRLSCRDVRRRPRGRAGRSGQPVAR